MPILRDYIVDNFNKGIITRVDQETLTRGASSDSLNWISLGDHIELRRGYSVLGSNYPGSGNITGLKTGRMIDGTEVVYRSHDKRIMALNSEYSHYGLEFDGADDNVQVSDDSTIQNIFDSGGAFACWVQPDNDGENDAGRIADKQNAGGSSGWYISVEDESGGNVSIHFRVAFSGTDGEWKTDVTVPTGSFSAFMVAYDSDSVSNTPQFYIDGVLVNTNTVTTPTGTREDDSGNDLYLGDNVNDNRCLDGILDEIRLYNTTQYSDVPELFYNNGSGNLGDKNESGLVAGYHFDEGSGSSATDYSSNSNTGTITGASYSSDVILSGDVWEEAGDDVLGTDADGEDISFDSYHSLAGAMMYASSPNSGIFKIPIANRNSVVNQNSNSHRGYIRIKSGAMYLWNRKDTDSGSDKTGIYRSHIDRDELSDYTSVTSESFDTGDGSTTTFSGTLATVSGTKTCMYVEITDGTETFKDDRSGNLVGDQGGSGTVNYATGAVEVTFNTAPTNLQAITADYYTEDATSNGIVDFSKATPRVAGEGFVIRQDDAGGDMMSMGSIGNDDYCLHEFKTWKLTIADADDDAVNNIYRGRVGIPYHRASEVTGDGIYYVDSQGIDETAIRLLRQSQFNDQVIPESISEQLKLDDYRFNKAVIQEEEPFIMVYCRTKESETNNRVLLYNKIWGIWDVLDYRANDADKYGTDIIVGDSISKNVFKLFNGYTDEEAEIINYWTSEDSLLGSEGVKLFNRFVIKGLIQPSQKLKISISLDRGSFTEIGNSLDNDDNHVYAVEGQGSYVDSGKDVEVGSSGIGVNEIGGGGSGDVAHPYQREFVVASDRFERIRVRIEAVGVGYVSVKEYQVKDIRYKGRSIPPQYVG